MSLFKIQSMNCLVLKGILKDIEGYLEIYFQRYF